MTTVQHQSQDLRRLTSAELDAVSGAWSVGSSGDGGISFEFGSYSGTVWSDSAAIATTKDGVLTVRFYRW